ncbi:MAG: thioredoxin TrxC [Desulfamplus sp.]|nr:thioredoxin TrxC [Desulfamplus sp.]
MSEDKIIIACKKCKTKNRIPVSRVNERPICSKCKESLAGIPYFTVNATDSMFQKEVMEHKGAVLVDCWAPWCGPCRSIGPVLDDLAREYAGQIKIVKINMDENHATAAQYSVKSIPTMLFFKHGKLVDTAVGALAKSEIINRINAML